MHMISWAAPRTTSWASRYRGLQHEDNVHECAGHGHGHNHEHRRHTADPHDKPTVHAHKRGSDWRRRQWATEEDLAAFGNRIPRGRIGTACDVGRAVAFFLPGTDLDLDRAHAKTAHHPHRARAYEQAFRSVCGCHFVSDEADYTTGATLHVDGGFTSAMEVQPNCWAQGDDVSLKSS